MFDYSGTLSLCKKRSGTTPKNPYTKDFSAGKFVLFANLLDYGGYSPSADVF